MLRFLVLYVLRTALSANRAHAYIEGKNGPLSAFHWRRSTPSIARENSQQLFQMAASGV